MSLQPFARAIFSNTKKGHAIRPDSSVVDSENKTLTLSNSKDNTTPEQDLQLLKTSSREKQADIDHNAAIDTGERETWELTNAGSEFESLVRETLSAKLVQLPRPPSFSPKNTTDGTASAMPATSRDGSGGSSLSRDSCMWSLPSSSLHLPNSLLDDEEILLRPLKETFTIQDNKFDEGDQYDIIEEIGSGAFGKCSVALTRIGPPVFVIKKCHYKLNELLALSLAKKESVMEIVDYYGAKLKGRNAYICMEFMTGGTILKLVQRQTSFRAGAWPIIREETCFPLVKDVLKGEEFLNNNGLVHGDIKADNVLLDEYYTHAKLTDFASAENIRINGELKRRLPAKRLIYDRTVARDLERMLFRVKLVRPVLADRTDMMFCKEGKKMETGSSIMPLCATMFLSMSAVTTSGLPEITGGRGRPRRGKIYTPTGRLSSFTTVREHIEIPPPRGQYRAGDAPGLQPIPEHSRAGNQLTEDNDKKRRIEARNTGSNGRQSGETADFQEFSVFRTLHGYKESGGSFDDIWKTGCLLLFMLNGQISPLFGLTGGGYQRQRSVNPEEYFPPQEKVKAKGETMELLKMFFGIDREYLPNATEILRVASVFQEK
ncbi:Serine/threonine-protein kinase OSR1 [Acropora cervicornis]|uniref:Serine/threonine-protein kinase OSR1 n=1 Tax=Acropora cervicornis TaxID=6130 RepID=A0AAD9UTB3_ACRCE|nr:Serine/threonine-protein kinase OSR1 [Acropora cervicornis]